MMSNWTDFRDEVLKNLHFETVTEEMKEAFSEWLLRELFPALKESGSKFCQQIKEQAKTESGWCKVRDLIVLPLIINVGLWTIEKSLEKTTSQG
jgi:hypothetical protein